jgi:hypothetical protein
MPSSDSHSWAEKHTARLLPLLCRVRVLCQPEIGSRLDSITTPQQALELLASHGSSELGFLQFFNLHRSQPDIQQLVRDPRLAGTAAQLLAARRVRLYQVGAQGVGFKRYSEPCRLAWCRGLSKGFVHAQSWCMDAACQESGEQ